MAHVNILKQVKADDRWRLVAIPRNRKGGYDWESLPDGRDFIEWYECGKRKRETGGGTAAEALEKARLRRHLLEGKSLGLAGPEEEEHKRTAIHVAVKHYLSSVEALKKPNTLRNTRRCSNASSNSCRRMPIPGRSRGMTSRTSWCG